MRPILTKEYLQSQDLSTDFVSRFEKKFNKSDGCWDWIGGRDREGYGIALRGSGQKRKSILAHRASWIIHFGPIPEGCDVLHNCPGGDKRCCVNPVHLWVGSHSENMQDAATKGRLWTATGPDNSSAKLNWKQVKTIREMYNTGKYSQFALADAFSVTQRTINKIVNLISYYPNPIEPDGRLDRFFT